MSITVKPVTPDFVAEISGLDLAQPLKPADHDAIEVAINRYAIVVFHDQKLTDGQQIDFARQFGPIHSPAQKARHTGIKHRIGKRHRIRRGMIKFKSIFSRVARPADHAMHARHRRLGEIIIFNQPKLCARERLHDRGCCFRRLHEC